MIPNTIRGRVAMALADAGLTKMAVHAELRLRGHADVGYALVCSVARGGVSGNGRKGSPKADAVRALIAEMTGRSVDWLFMTEEARGRTKSG